MRSRNVLGILASITLFSATVMLFLYRQEAIDWWRLRGYEPSPAIARLATNASFTDEARRLFYIHDPELVTKENFTGRCSVSEETIVLGCYITNTKIYIFDVNDERLDGIEEVTAAHEMLHAAWDRLSDDEKEYLRGFLHGVLETSDDERFINTIESYRKRDPSIVTNELHSIVGTEIRDIPQELEEYYARYFLNRLAVVEQAENYAQEFVSRQNQIKAFDAQLEELKLKIERAEADIEQLNNALAVEREQLEATRSNPQEYNARVPGYNAKIESYNRLVQQLRADIETYNNIVNQRNDVVIEERDLVNAIDTRFTETE